MYRIEIPGRDPMEAEHLVLDFNGTIAKDGHIHNKVRDAIYLLGKKVIIHILTADTRGNVEKIVQRLPVRLEILRGSDTAEEKAAFVHALGGEQVIAVGNGFNDRLMFQVAGLSLCIIGAEGASGAAIFASDAVFSSPIDALRFILKPLRHRATLRK